MKNNTVVTPAVPLGGGGFSGGRASIAVVDGPLPPPILLPTYGAHGFLSDLPTCSRRLSKTKDLGSGGTSQEGWVCFCEGHLSFFYIPCLVDRKLPKSGPWAFLTGRASAPEGQSDALLTPAYVNAY